jgi:hypothetical protein
MLCVIPWSAQLGMTRLSQGAEPSELPGQMEWLTDIDPVSPRWQRGAPTIEFASRTDLTPIRSSNISEHWLFDDARQFATDKLRLVLPVHSWACDI